MHKYLELPVLLLSSGVNGLYLGLGIAAGTLVLVIMVVTSIIIACKVRQTGSMYHGGIMYDSFKW